MQAAKTMQGIRWVSVDNFNALRRGEQVALTEKPEWVTSRTVLKNLINRLTFGTTPVEETAGGGNLYNADELMFVDVSGVNPAGMSISIYVKAEEATWRDKTWAEWAEHWLKLLAQSGYGAKKSAGYGYFELENWKRFTGFDEAPAGANGFITLSNWAPALDDPTNGFYARKVKYGKLGEELASSDNPFKFPLVMLTTGASFYADSPVRDWYGRLVQGIAPIDPRVVQYGYAFAVPARLEAEQ
jgi:CRISPR/Cas system CSM-associated protein Csm4 (group 5 of RAMP superfamily)